MQSSFKIALAAIMTTSSLIAGPANAALQIKPSPNGEVSIVVDFPVKVGKEAEFERVFHRSVTCSRLEPGNITFNVHRVIDQPRHYVLYEQWRSVDALNSHFARPYTKALFAMFDRNLEHPVADGLRFVADLQPAPRTAPAHTDPATVLECR